jgi:putative NADH-flavin reductase
MSSCAVTGASGRLGRFAVGELLSRGLPASNIVALVRTPSKAADLAERGVEVREADYSRPDTLNAETEPHWRRSRGVRGRRDGGHFFEGRSVSVSVRA